MAFHLKKVFQSNLEPKQPPQFEQVLEKLQKIDIETGLDPVPTQISSLFPTQDPIILDQIKISEDKIQELQNIISNLEATNTSIDTEFSLIRDQVIQRDHEIKRLGVQLEIARSQQWGGSGGGGNTEFTTTGSSASINDINVAKRRIDQLEMQIEHLQEHIENVEKVSMK